MAIVPLIPNVDQQIEVSRVEDINLIIDMDNLILAHQAHPVLSSGITYFKGTSNLVKPIKELSVSMDIDMSS